jgi:uncharacterized protein (TIGR03905 family)
MKYIYKPIGVCTTQMIFEINDGVIKNFIAINGCAGYTIGMSKMLQGQKIDDVIKRLRHIKCGKRKTSCPDQIAIALQKYKKLYKK